MEALTTRAKGTHPINWGRMEGTGYQGQQPRGGEPHTEGERKTKSQPERGGEKEVPGRGKSTCKGLEEALTAPERLWITVAKRPL